MHPFKKAVFLGVAIILIFSAGCSMGASSQSGGLIISEVVSSNSNSLTDPVFGKPDWVELCNTSPNPINLLDYSIAESSKSRFVFPDITIAPGEYMIVYCCSMIEGITSDNLCTGFKLSKSGTTLILSGPNVVIGKLDIPALVTDISYGITKNGTYAFFGIPTPGAANTTESSPDLAGLESDKNVSLKINEVMPKTSSNAESSWAEIFNSGDKTIELSDYYITEDLSDITKARLPEKQLGAGEYTIIKFTGDTGADEIPFKLGSNETLLAISNNFGAVIDDMSWSAAILPGMSAGRENNSTVYFIEPTPSSANNTQYTEEAALLEGISDVRINEILLKNDFSLIDQDGDRSEWVELYNASQTTVSLLGYSLSDREDDPLKWRLPDIELGAGQYLIVFLSGKNRTGDELHANFSLGDGDSKLLLSNINAGTVQTVDLPAERKDNVSYGFSSDVQWLFYYQPTPSAENSTQGFADMAQVESRMPELRINEVATVGEAKKKDQKDWVELRNQLSSDINLSGFFLSDNKNDLQKWPLGNITVKAGGYKVVDEYQNGDGSGEIKISSSGEKIYLSTPEGEVIDQFDTGVLRPGTSRGLTSDNTPALFDTPTPGKENGGEVLQGYCAVPVFSVNGGYKKSSFKLEISTPTQGGTIHYTLDGSTPTAKSTAYSGPVEISKTTPVRAITVASGRLRSDETVATYLFEDPHSLPVVCLSMTSRDFKTVYKSTRYNKQERGGYVEYYEADGTLGVRFPAGLRIAGAGTIEDHAPQLSINLYLRGGYGRSSVTYPFFEGYDITTFKSLSLRNMGAWQDDTRLKDAFISMAVNGMNIDNAQSKFAVVYINGKYWGLYEFKENQNEDYFASKHGIDRDKVVMVRGNKYNVETIRTDRDIVDLYALAQRNMNDPDNFEKYTSFADSDYFMDYLIAETFFYCNDTYNQKYAHTADNTMKWRPIFYDFDICFSSKSSVNFHTFFRDIYVRGAPLYGGRPRETWMYLYNAFIKNDEWEQKFIERYAEVLNTVLATDNLLKLYDGMVDSIESEIPRTADKWPYPRNLEKNWKGDAASLRKIIEVRRDYVIKALKNYFDISDERMGELFPNG
jgi:hypothetical protein